MMTRGSVVLALVPVGSDTGDRLVRRWIPLQNHHHTAAQRQSAGRAASLLGRAALLELLARQTNRTDWVLKTHPHGGLFAQAAGSIAGPMIGLSHSKGIVACAVSHIGPIGIDIESHRPRSFDGIADYAFGPIEQAQVQRRGGSAFYRIWTLREAIAKIAGEGLSMVADGHDRIESEPEVGCWIARQQVGAWRLAHFFLGSGCSLAIAMPGDGLPWDISSLAYVDLADPGTEDSGKGKDPMQFARLLSKD